MNQKLKELSDLALKSIPVEGTGSFTREYIEKLYELTVRECAEQIRSKGTDWMDWQPSKQGIRPEYAEMAKHISVHFGVE